MARKRMLHPSFFTSATLATCSLRSMITFAGLWVYCDDYGRGEDDPAFIAATVWPRRPTVTGDDVAADLIELAEAGPVCRYDVGGFSFLHVVSWDEHQKVQHPTRSKLPPCPYCEALLYREWYRDEDPATAKYRRAAKEAQERRVAGREGPSDARDPIPRRSRAPRETLRIDSS